MRDDDLLRLYWRELSYLRHSGAEFARRYPKVAARLELSPEGSADPHVERLVESFAYLAARIQHNIESDFPEVTTALLDLLYPHYLAPTPSMAIARFDVDHERGQLTSGMEIPRHTPLFCESPSGRTVRMRTGYPVTLWPIEVEEVAFDSPEKYSFLDSASDVAIVLRITLSAPTAAFEELGAERLRFYVHGDPIQSTRLYELLFTQVLRVAIVPRAAEARGGGSRDGEPSYLSSEAVAPVGFGTDEGILPWPNHSHPAYRLLQEYFAFPRKFQFFDLENLAGRIHGSKMDVLLLLDRLPERDLEVDRETFCLGATPVVNLFPKTTEPIRIDHLRTEYRLVADQRREDHTEIHSIRKVTTASGHGKKARNVAPFYSFDHEMGERGQSVFWHARRVPTHRADAQGTDMRLSFFDFDFNPRQPPDATLFAHTLCTNRSLARELPARARLHADRATPAAQIVCLDKPTPQHTPPLGGATLWRLISQLSLNHLSLSAGDQSLAALREILRLSNLSGSHLGEQQILGLREMASRRIVARVGDEAWRGFARGIEVSLTLDEDSFVGHGGYLFGAVLNRFFALYTSVNSFTQLVLRSTRREEVWKRWEPATGEQIVC